MQVSVNGKLLRLDQTQVLGSGGEGTVFRSKLGSSFAAIKVYHSPNLLRAKKLSAFLAKNWRLQESKIASPQALVHDSKGQQIIGFAMPIFERGFEELASLSNKKFRNSHIISVGEVVDVFMDGWQTLDSLHQHGLIIGDFNDLNSLFSGNQMLFIDVDAWQFDNFACPVATEQFLVPELYGVDLSKAPVFRPEYDWYSYAVLLFKSLLFTHPYGGIHRDYKRLTARAMSRVTVFDPQVTYPKIALSPDLLSDDLAHQFDQIFSKGVRERFPLDSLKIYRDSLVECISCGTHYPSTRKHCPICSFATLVIVTQVISTDHTIKVNELIRTQGPIIFSKVIGTKVYIIAYENSKAVMYTKLGTDPIERIELFNEIPGARFEISDNMLIVNLPGSSQLLLIDISGAKVEAVGKSETAFYAGNRRAIFRASNQYFFRISGGSLTYSQLLNGKIVERSLRPVSNEQTWFSVKQEVVGDKPTACGFFQVIQNQFWWLTWQGQSYDNLAVSLLEDGETLIDVTVKFSSLGVLIRRATQHLGTEYVRTDIVGANGQITFQSPRIRREDLVSAQMHGLAYSNSKLLHATDDGVVQEDVVSGQAKTFDATRGYVQEGNSLYPYRSGLLVVNNTTVAYIALS